MAADAVDTHVTYEILLSGGCDARVSGFGVARRGVEVRVSSYLGTSRRGAGARGGGADTASSPGGYRFGARRIHIRGPADTHSGPERVSTCAGYRFGCECVTSPGRPRYRFVVRTCIDLRGIQVRVRMCGSGPAEGPR